MSEARWTGGEWRARFAEPWQIGDCSLGIQIWGDCRVAMLELQVVGPEQSMRNAQLMAAAPDLYAALLALVQAVRASGKLESREFVGLGIQCNAALAKAEGQMGA